MIYDDLAAEFALNAWHWTIGANDTIPGPDDIKKVVEDSIKALHGAPIGSTVQIGRLVVVKEHDTHGIYIYRGDVK